MLNLPNHKLAFNWLKKNKAPVTLFLIILLGAYLRLHDFNDLARFNADQVRDAKIVDVMNASGEFPLLGPKAGGTTFKLGPAFYYLQYLSGAIFGFTPEGIAFFIPIFSVASIYLFHIFFRNIFSDKITLGLTLLYAASFYVIKYSRFAWNPNAIPFFLFAFLNLALAIILKKRALPYHIALGIIVGIGVQLHTTLLVLLPVFTFGLYAYIFIKNRRLPAVKIVAMMLTIIFLNSPFILSDISSSGENLKNFFLGAETKTKDNISIATNLQNGASFILQGTAYSLTGFEAQKDWSKPMKLLKSKSVTETTSALAATLLVFFGIYLAIMKMKKEKNQNKKTALCLITLTTIASFFLFTLIGEELNLRFFIVIIFLPFVFLGLILEFFSDLFSSGTPRLATLLVASFLFIFMSLNLVKYARVYDLENYQEKEGAYGGISLMEARSLSGYMTDSRRIHPGSKLFMFPFEFKRSVDYFNSKSSVSIETYDEDDLAAKSVVFLVAEKDADGKSLEKISSQFDLLDQKNIGRFTIFELSPKNIINAN